MYIDQKVEVTLQEVIDCTDTNDFVKLLRSRISTPVNDVGFSVDKVHSDKHTLTVNVCGENGEIPHGPHESDVGICHCGKKFIYDDGYTEHIDAYGIRDTSADNDHMASAQMEAALCTNKDCFDSRAKDSVLCVDCLKEKGITVKE